MTVEEIREKWRPRNKNKRASVEMWDSMAESFGGDRIPSPEDDRFLRILQENHMFGGDSVVLDVGCGTGTYSFALAGRCERVVGVDLSPKMIELAKQRAARECTGNVEFFCADWNELDLKQAGWEKKFDLVFAHMTPAVQSADTFLKLLSAGRGWCAMSKPTRRTDPVSDAVKKLVGITERRESSDREILYAFSLLWMKGLMPFMDYEKQCWNMKKTPEEAYGLYLNRVKTYRDVTPEEEEKIKRYLRSLMDGGLICEDVDTTVTTMYWQV